jgi:DNA polymerase delta subunit 2
VENILDIRQGEDTVIIGTLFKEQTKKPSILSNIMGVLGAKKFHNAEGEFNHGAYVTAEG